MAAFVCTCLPPAYVTKGASSMWKWSHVRQSCKKNFFCPVFRFSTKKYPNFVCADAWRIELNKCLFSSQFFSFWVELCHKSTVLEPFYSKNAKVSATIGKCPNFLPEMSGILYTRIRLFATLMLDTDISRHTVYIFINHLLSDCSLPQFTRLTNAIF